MEGVINSRKTHKEKAGKLKTLRTFKGKCAQMKMRFAIEAYTLLMLQVRIYSTKLNYLNMCVELDMNWSSIRPAEPAALHCDHVTRKIRSCKPNGRQIESERERERERELGQRQVERPSSASLATLVVVEPQGMHSLHAMGAPRRTTRKSIRRIGIF